MRIIVALRRFRCNPRIPTIATTGHPKPGNILCSEAEVRAVVVTVTATLCDPAPFGPGDKENELGLAVQAAAAGAPLQVTEPETDWFAMIDKL